MGCKVFESRYWCPICRKGPYTVLSIIAHLRRIHGLKGNKMREALAQVAMKHPDFLKDLEQVYERYGGRYWSPYKIRIVMNALRKTQISDGTKIKEKISKGFKVVVPYNRFNSETGKFVGKLVIDVRVPQNEKVKNVDKVLKEVKEKINAWLKASGIITSGLASLEAIAKKIADIVWSVENDYVRVKVSNVTATGEEYVLYLKFVRNRLNTR